jgi:hypothetical protein
MSEIQQLEQQLETADYLIKRKDAAIRLSNNKDFKRLVIDEYFTAEAARLIMASGDPNLTEQQRADFVAMGQACGHFKRYLSAIVREATMAERDVPNIEETLAELRAEAGDNFDVDAGGVL